MFHSISLKPIEFKSNPKLDPIPHVVRNINETGSPINEVHYLDRDNKSPFKGSHFDPDRHSLRAMLNMGIQLQPVNYDITDNDINSLNAKARRLSSQIESNIKSRSVSPSNSSENESAI